MSDVPAAPDTGSLRQDLIALLDYLLRELADLGDVVSSRVGELRRNPDLAAAMEEIPRRPPQIGARRVRTGRDLRLDDVVLGEFLGDSDLLFVALSELDLRLRFLVALPLDERSEWYEVGPGLGHFLHQFCIHGGAKYWE